jgi:hypothetical protein
MLYRNLRDEETDDEIRFKGPSFITERRRVQRGSVESVADYAQDDRVSELHLSIEGSINIDQPLERKVSSDPRYDRKLSSLLSPLTVVEEGQRRRREIDLLQQQIDDLERRSSRAFDQEVALSKTYVIGSRSVVVSQLQ